MDAKILDELFATILSRRGSDPDASYTAKLLAGGTAYAVKKLGEEAIETVIAAISEPRDKLAAESADLLYHLLVVWAAAGLTAEEVWDALAKRQGVSGIAEKASRPKG